MNTNNNTINFEKLPEIVQEYIDDSVHNEFWDLMFYNPSTGKVNFYDRDSGTTMPKPWLEVIY
jgi:hypothetical protein